MSDKNLCDTNASPELKQAWKKREKASLLPPQTTPAAGINENALLKIDHFYPSDVHFYFKPADTIPSITPSSSDVRSLGENTDTNTASVMSCPCCCVAQTLMVSLPLIAPQSDVQTGFFCANKVEVFPPFKINIGNKCPAFPTIPSNYRSTWPSIAVRYCLPGKCLSDYFTGCFGCVDTVRSRPFSFDHLDPETRYSPHFTGLGDTWETRSAAADTRSAPQH